MLERVYCVHPLQLYKVLITTNLHFADEEQKHQDNLSKATWLFTSRPRTELYVCRKSNKQEQCLEAFGYFLSHVRVGGCKLRCQAGRCWEWSRLGGDSGSPESSDMTYGRPPAAPLPVGTRRPCVHCGQRIRVFKGRWKYGYFLNPVIFEY